MTDDKPTMRFLTTLHAIVTHEKNPFLNSSVSFYYFNTKK